MSRLLGRLAREERGSVFVLAAVLIPLVFLVLVAMVVDVGTWYTHKRQLQNRADAGALSAGVQYSTNWAACGGDATEKAQAAGLIDAAGRQYAGDPQQANSVYNTEVTEQTRINVEINSNAPGGWVDPNTSWNDPGGSNLGPCDKHPADAFSGPDAYYVDVGVRERDQRSLFGMFGVNLLRNEAHARVALLTAAAGNGFLPIALPDQDIRQAEIRYYQWCSPNNANPPKLLKTVPLNILGSGYQTASGTTLWGPTATGANGDPPVGVSLPIPEDGDCSPGDNSIYMPVRAQVRISGVDKTVLDIDNYSCAQLVTMQYADCWDQVSDFSVDGDNPRTQPWFHEVTLTGGSGAGQCAPDAYFAKPPAGTTSCAYGVTVRVDTNGLGTSPPPGRTFKVSVGGSALTPPAAGVWDGVWTGSASNGTLGRSTVNLTWTCTDQDPKFPNDPTKRVPCPGANGTTLGGGTVPVHSTFLGNRANSSVVKLVRTSLNAQLSGGQPGAELHWYPAPQDGNPSAITVYPTLGLEGSLFVGQRKILRAPHCKNNTNSSNCDADTSSPNNSQSIDCEPGGAQGGQGHDFVMFANGCQPWYAPNTFTDGPWWTTATKSCPPAPTGSSPNLSPPWDPNNQGSPRECVVKAPGFSPNVIADGIAAAIGNCSNVQSNSCQQYACTNYNYYDPSKPAQWALQGGEPSARVVFLFIVPYGAYKDSTSQGVLPILNFAAFYVTGWMGKGNGAQQNPCPTTDPDGSGPKQPEDMNLSGGDIVGYFVDYTLPNAPGDPNNYCQIGQLTPCVPVLVR